MNQSPPSPQTMAAHENFKLFLNEQMQSGASQLVNFLIDNKKRNTATSSCHEDLLRVSSSALKNERWALEVFDSNGRPSSGLMSGSLFNFIGRYEQCVANQMVSTKYCMAQMDLSPGSKGLAALTGLSETMFAQHSARLGLCVPDTCNSDDLAHLFNNMSSSVTPAPRIPVQQFECSSGNNQQFQNPRLGFIVFATMISLLVGLCLWATAADGSQNRKTKRSAGQLTLIRTFSLTRALRRMTTKRNVRSALDSLKVISMLWTIAMHSYSFGFQWLMYDNLGQANDAYKSPWIQWLANGSFAVDNFFLISGILAWFKCCNTRTERPATRYLILAGLRYLRLVPVMMLFVSFSVTVLPELSHGPNWSSSTMMFNEWCQTNWPLNLFMVLNLFKRYNMCFSHSWYVAVDFQLFLLVLFVHWLGSTSTASSHSPAETESRKKSSETASTDDLSTQSPREKSYKWILIGCVIVAQVSVALVVYLLEVPSIPQVPVDSPASMIDYYSLVYIKPYYWLASYFIGALLVEYRMSPLNKPLRAKQVAQKRSWPIGSQNAALLVMALLLFSAWPYFGRLKEPMSRLESSLFALLSRPLWSICTAILLYSTSIRPGRMLSSILKSKFWLVPSRLSYSAFLLNPITIAIFYGSRTETFQFSHSLLLYFTIGNIVLSYLGALCVYLFIEHPLFVMIDLIKGKLAAEQEPAKAQLKRKLHLELSMRLSTISLREIPSE